MNAMVEVAFPGTNVDDRYQGFPERVAESQRRVFQIAYSVLANAADAEEIAQEVFLRACQKFSGLRDPRKFLLWVSRMAFRQALNRQRAQRRQLARDTSWQAAGQSATVDARRIAEDRIFLDRLRGEIDHLPEKLKTVLLLSAIEDMDAAEVSRILKIPTATVRSRLYLARKRLMGALEL